MNLRDSYRKFHPKEYTLQGNQKYFQNRPHTMPKTSLSKFEKTEIKSLIFSDHRGLRLEIRTRKKKTAIKTLACGV